MSARIDGPLRPAEVADLLGGGQAATMMPTTILVGMPHLCLGALSETWLLKECGHRHWLLLAAAAGLDIPNFHDNAGESIYAAFLAVSVRDAAMDAVREHDHLDFSSQLVRGARTQFTSFHRISVHARQVAEIAMISTFVKRVVARRNHAIARVEVPGLPPVVHDAQTAAFAAETAALRSNGWSAHMGLQHGAASIVERLLIDPCPGQDFNGADFLYFASYQAFIDRAEWAHFRQREPLLTTRRRDIIYRGNIDPGERVVATLRQYQRRDAHLVHWYRLERDTDAAAIADVFTARHPCAAT
jgi:probable biosynthetic protein (TIGR04099 family)